MILIPYSTVLNINVSVKEFNQVINSVLQSERDDAENTVPLNNIVIEENEVVQNTKADGALGCIVGIFILLIYWLAAEYAINISYLRFLLGLMGIFLILGGITLLGQSLQKKFTLKIFAFFILIFVIFSIYFLWVFNIFNVFRLI